jgi:HK97 family phage major capsid protein
MSLATNPRDFRTRFNLNQTELGNIVGRSRGTVSQWEQGAPVDVAAQRLLDTLSTAEASHVRALAEKPLRNDVEPDFGAWMRTAQVGVEVRDLSPQSPDGRYDATIHVARREIPMGELFALCRADASPLTTVTHGSLIPQSRIGLPLSPLALSSRLARLGASYEPQEAGVIDLEIPRIDADPAAAWIGEGDDLARADVRTSAVRVPFKTVGTSLSISRRLLSQTGGGVAEIAATSIIRSLTRAADAAALAGAGGVEPDGVLSPAVGVPTYAPESFDAAAWLTIRETLEAAGIDPDALAVAAGPAAAKRLRGVSFDGRTLWRDERGQQCGGRPAAVFDTLPAGLLLVGDFSRLRILHAANVQIVLRETSSNGAREMFAFLNLATVVTHAPAFLAVTLPS